MVAHYAHHGDLLPRGSAIEQLFAFAASHVAEDWDAPLLRWICRDSGGGGGGGVGGGIGAVVVSRHDE